MSTANMTPAQKAKRDENRRRYPDIAAFVDALRRRFGKGVRVESIEDHRELPDRLREKGL